MNVFPRRPNDFPPATGGERSRGWGQVLGRVAVWPLVAAIRAYQRTLSPLLPIVTLGGCVCRFSPSCSEYAAGALVAHGPGRGLWLAVRRLARCTPLSPGGFDPVPEPSGERSSPRRIRPGPLRCTLVRR